MKKLFKLTACFVSLSLAGCANDPNLGVALSQLQAEQTLNSDAWYENIDYLPDGSGERTQRSLKVYNSNSSAKK
ncbi:MULTISPECIES: hypothetical protein [unclassified Vibrio]|uniref:hypothetical protein n=1 Tax=unclassified Vibrio TaxID=2614977 RepID=UPI000243B1FB|nr:MULTISPECIES: hypothetical protein [unclassified Vibrio]AEX22977.1 hypothetical protein VEJY3_12505 [Vibrio sp. EJY3]AXT71590.1 hypothetical protein DBX26_11265 [Vibrio sp. dhg]MEE3879490.1 hypothetical protein [Vibrio sp. YYF0003]